MALVPRLKWPLELGALGQLATVEQDSDEDIEQCLKALFLTRVGDRPDMPDVGVPDLTFTEEPMDLDEVTDVLTEREPRASVLVSEQPDALEQLVSDLRIEWAASGQRADEEDTPDG
jgi:hypothetical protein